MALGVGWSTLGCFVLEHQPWAILDGWLTFVLSLCFQVVAKIVVLN